MERKQVARSNFLNQRLELSELEFKERERGLIRVFERVDFSDLHVLHIFLSSSAKREIDTFSMIAYLRRVYPSLKILVPKMLAAEGEFKSLILEENTALEINKWGILEPLSSREVDAAEIDMVIVPLVAVDTRGHRIGYGKGYYDRFLNTCRPDSYFVGLSLFDPVEPCWEVEAFDVALHACICPTGMRAFPSRTSI